MQKVLIASTNQQMLETLMESLSHKYEVVCKTSVEDLMQQVESSDIILLDDSLSSMDGIDVLMQLLPCCSVPVLMLTSIDKPQCALEAVRLGAANFLVKTEEFLKLIPLVVIDTISNFAERQEMEQTISTLTSKVAELEVMLDNPASGGRSNIDKTPSAQRNIVAEMVAQLKRGEINLPACPKMGVELRQMINKGSTFAEIAVLLNQDMSVVSRLISVSNSTYYGGVTPISGLEDAVSRLGLKQTVTYVEVIENRALYTIKDPDLKARLPELWCHSLACAHISSLLAKDRLSDPDAAFTNGLLHDIGILLFLQILSEMKLKGALEGADSSQIDSLAYDHHGQFGGVLLKRWKMPEVFVQTAQWHENLEKADTISKELLVVYLADRMARDLGFGYCAQRQQDDTPLEELEVAKTLSVSADEIEAISSEVKKLMAGCGLGLDETQKKES